METDPSKISAEAFLRMARRAPAGESWAKMEGTATHRRSGSSAVKDTIRVGIRFTPAEPLRVSAYWQYRDIEQPDGDWISFRIAGLSAALVF